MEKNYGYSKLVKVEYVFDVHDIRRMVEAAIIRDFGRPMQPHEKVTIEVSEARDEEQNDGSVKKYEPEIRANVTFETPEER